jgi:hypothetical protein
MTNAGDEKQVRGVNIYIYSGTDSGRQMYVMMVAGVRNAGELGALA